MLAHAQSAGNRRHLPRPTPGVRRRVRPPFAHTTRAKQVGDRGQLCSLCALSVVSATSTFLPICRSQFGASVGDRPYELLDLTDIWALRAGMNLHTLLPGESFSVVLRSNGRTDDGLLFHPKHHTERWGQLVALKLRKRQAKDASVTESGERTIVLNDLQRVPDSLNLGTLLVAAGHVTIEQLDTAIETQQSSGRRIGEVLLANRAVDEYVVAEALAGQYARAGQPPRERRSPQRSLR